MKKTRLSIRCGACGSDCLKIEEDDRTDRALFEDKCVCFLCGHVTYIPRELRVIK